jgi:hypothetical protein
MLIEKEETEFKKLEEEEKELQSTRNFQMSKKQELNLILLESEVFFFSSVLYLFYFVLLLFVF